MPNVCVVMNEAPESQDSVPVQAAYVFAALWIFAVSGFYYTRVTYQVYATHQPEINALLERFTDFLSMTGS